MKKIVFILSAVLSSLSLLAADSSFYFKTSDKVKLYVRIAGEGRPCVFVHGGPRLYQLLL